METDPFPSILLRNSEALFRIETEGVGIWTGWVSARAKCFPQPKADQTLIVIPAAGPRSAADRERLGPGETLGIFRDDKKAWCPADMLLMIRSREPRRRIPDESQDLWRPGAGLGYLKPAAMETSLRWQRGLAGRIGMGAGII